MTRLKFGYAGARGVTRSVRFYAEALGIGLKSQDGERWVQFDLGGVGFAIASQSEFPAGASGSLLVFEVDDLARSLAAVIAAGEAMVDQRNMGSHGKVATVRDPDGNLLQLFAPSVTSQA
jgi:predicted enzyme related to lactoylglutathione lyase